MATVSQVGTDGIRVQTGKLNEKETTVIREKLANAYMLKTMRLHLHIYILHGEKMSHQKHFGHFSFS